MRVSFSAEQTGEIDGVEGSVSVSRSEVDTVEELLAFFSDCARASGFTYWNATGATMDDTEEVWEKW